MKFNVFEIKKRLDSGSTVIILTIGVAFGMSAPLGINVPFRGLSHESTVINQTNHLCSVCCQEKLASEFASKGKGRLSRLCRECDNERRRSSYKPRTSRNCRSEVTVIFEAHEGQQVHGVMMIFDLLTEHGLILTEDLKSDDDPIVDQLIRRKSVIDEIT